MSPTMSRRSASSSSASLGLAYVAGAGILGGTGWLAVVLDCRNEALSALTIGAYRTGLAAVVVLIVVLGLRRALEVRQVLLRSLVRASSLVCSPAVPGLVLRLRDRGRVTASTVISLGLAPVILTGDASVRTRAAPRPRAIAVVVAALVGLVLIAWLVDDRR